MPTDCRADSCHDNATTGSSLRAIWLEGLNARPGLNQLLASAHKLEDIQPCPAPPCRQHRADSLGINHGLLDRAMAPGFCEQWQQRGSSFTRLSSPVHLDFGWAPKTIRTTRQPRKTHSGFGC